MTTGALALVAVACKPADSTPPPGDGGGGDGAKQPEGCPASQDDLISDFKMDNSLHAVDGRQGGWYTYGDPNLNMGATITAEVDVAQGGPCSGAGAWHVKAQGFKDWGAATGTDFKPRQTGTGMPKDPYDASKYKGIAFWIKSAVPLEGVQVSFPDLYTDGDAPLHAMSDPADPTNNCTDCKCIYNGQSWQNCSPYLVQFAKKGDAGAAVAFAKYMDTPIDTTWRRIQVDFADTRQDPGNLGYKGPGDMLSKDKLTSMALQVNPNYDVMPKMMRDFEIWIDDVTFVK